MILKSSSVVYFWHFCNTGMVLWVVGLFYLLVTWWLNPDCFHLSCPVFGQIPKSDTVIYKEITKAQQLCDSKPSLGYDSFLLRDWMNATLAFLLLSHCWMVSVFSVWSTLKGKWKYTRKTGRRFQMNISKGIPDGCRKNIWV